MKKCCFTCKECYCAEPEKFIHVCKKRKSGVEPNNSACQDYEVKKEYANIVEENKTYEIDVNCMWDREHMEWVPTIYQCGCCHVRVNKTDTICPHCRSKLNPINN